MNPADNPTTEQTVDLGENIISLMELNVYFEYILLSFSL